MNKNFRKLSIALITIALTLCLTGVFASAQTRRKTVRVSTSNLGYTVFGNAGDTVIVSVYNLTTRKLVKASNCYRIRSNAASVARITSVGKYAYIKMNRKGSATVEFFYRYNGKILRARLNVKVV